LGRIRTHAAQHYSITSSARGWTLVKARYDDGGYSGGSTDRPDLQRLLDDIRARKIDAIVVCKVDRLTRSLADFAKLVELFDAHGVSFVSVIKFLDDNRGLFHEPNFAGMRLRTLSRSEPEPQAKSNRFAKALSTSGPRAD
jgi:hypothetical protein